MNSLDQLLNVYKCIDVQDLSLCLSATEWHIILGNAVQLSYLIEEKFGDHYNVMLLSEDIEDLIPHATCYISQYNDLCVVNLETAPEGFEI